MHSRGALCGLPPLCDRYRRRRNRYPVSETIGDRGGRTSEGGRKSTWQVTNPLPFL